MPPRPHLFDDVGVGLGDLSLHTQRVGEVQLLQVGALQEVLGQRRSVTQTLQRETRRREESGPTKGHKAEGAKHGCWGVKLIPDITPGGLKL